MKGNTPDPNGSASVVLYPGASGAVSFSLSADEDTIWGTRSEIAKAFGCTEQNVLQHIQNIYESGELAPEGTRKKSLQVRSEGNRTVKREADVFNLDVILSVGYRVSSPTATKFRQWA